LACLYPALNRLDEAERVFERLEAMCREKGDERHLGAIVVNRTYLWMARNDKPRLEDDLKQAVTYSRELGCNPLEEHARINMAVFLHWRGEYDEAGPHARRLIEIQEGHLGQANRPSGRLLLARVLRARGDEEAARGVVDDILRHQERARADGKAVAL